MRSTFYLYTDENQLCRCYEPFRIINKKRSLRRILSEKYTHESGLDFLYGMNVNVIVGPNHPRSNFITPLTAMQLEIATPFVMRANETLKRRVTSDYPHLELIQRSFWIVKNAKALFAFGYFEDRKHKRISGGTAWPVQMALDAGTTNLFFFDISSQCWFCPYFNRLKQGRWVEEFGFEPLDPSYSTYPVLCHCSAVVGSRLIDNKTVEEIEDLCLKIFFCVL